MDRKDIDMKYIKLGDSNIEVSRFALGCMSFGDPKSKMHAWTLDPNQTQEIVSHALDLGINFFDTANTYSAGTSEEYLSRAFKNLGVPKEAILREVEGSLKRLNTDYIDLYIIHRFDYTTPIEETMETLDSLVKSGKVRALGASAMYGYQFHNMQLAAEKNNWTKFVSMQNHYNLLYREDERELIPICKQMNVSLTPYSPLAAGRLSRSWDEQTLRNKTDETAKAKYDKTIESDI